MNSEDTLIFSRDSISEKLVYDTLKEVFEILKERGYNPVNQIVGYILSGDPTYITSHKDARNKIRQIERDELLEMMVRNYIGLDE